MKWQEILGNVNWRQQKEKLTARVANVAEVFEVSYGPLFNRFVYLT